MRYSLSDYIVTIQCNGNSSSIFGDIRIGGQGSYLGNISVSRDKDMWSTRGFETGAYVHEKNLDKTGKVDLKLNQLSNDVVRFIRLANLMYNDDIESCTITVVDRLGNTIVICNDCVIVKIPDQEFGTTSSDQSWTFSCGEVLYQM